MGGARGYAWPIATDVARTNTRGARQAWESVKPANDLMRGILIRTLLKSMSSEALAQTTRKATKT